MEYHKPVLLNEVLSYLNVDKEKKFIDATLGDGGHTLEILKRGGSVLGLDYSSKSLERTTARIKEQNLERNFVGVLANFREIDEVAKKYNFTNVDGILFDLGFSSTQLEQDEKGLSFIKNATLDMRLDENLGVTAADLLNTLSEKQLEELFRVYGEEHLAKRFAKAIVDFRNLKKFETTKELADLLASQASPGYEHGRIHPATRVFQALRIVVNDEIENLKIALPRAARLLKLPGGRMVVISFHSLEDRTVKEFGRVVRPALKTLTKKPISPSAQEIKTNKRARSAKMRVFEA